jgi:SWI/SNF-related matrix-associated actin-dependent regulator of chromatin subfamily A member 5
MRTKLCATYKEGFGNWEEVKALIDASWQFKFDYFFKSKTPEELERRCNTLLRAIEKVRRH